jgi:hypothetical protein
LGHAISLLAKTRFGHSALLNREPSHRRRTRQGAEFCADVLVWQGYGLSNTLGMAAFPNGEAYRVGKTFPDASVCHAVVTLEAARPVGRIVQ